MEIIIASIIVLILVTKLGPALLTFFTYPYKKKKKWKN